MAQECNACVRLVRHHVPSAVAYNAKPCDALDHCVCAFAALTAFTQGSHVLLQKALSTMTAVIGIGIPRLSSEHTGSRDCSTCVGGRHPIGGEAFASHWMQCVGHPALANLVVTKLKQEFREGGRICDCSST